MTAACICPRLANGDVVDARLDCPVHGPEIDSAATPSLVDRLRDVDEPNALIVRRRAADEIERLRDALANIGREDRLLSPSTLRKLAREAVESACSSVSVGGLPCQYPEGHQGSHGYRGAEWFVGRSG